MKFGVSAVYVERYDFKIKSCIGEVIYVHLYFDKNLSSKALTRIIFDTSNMENIPVLRFVFVSFFFFYFYQFEF